MNVEVRKSRGKLGVTLKWYIPGMLDLDSKLASTLPYICSFSLNLSYIIAEKHNNPFSDLIFQMKELDTSQHRHLCNEVKHCGG